MIRAIGSTISVPPQQFGIAQEFLGFGAGLEHLDHLLVDGAAGRDHESLAHLREGL